MIRPKELKGNEGPDVGKWESSLFERLYPPALCLALALITVHFLLITVTVMPDNVLSGAGDDFAVRYVEPSLRQKWSLFAPDPLSGDLQILGRARQEGGEWTEWTDIYSPVVAEVRGTPFSPRALARVTLLRSAVIPLRRFVTSTPKETEEMLEEWQDLETKPAEVVALERTASGELRERYPDRRFDEVQVRLLLTHLAGTEQAGAPLVRLTFLEARFDPAVEPLGGP
jgi:hypothetical protein